MATRRREDEAAIARLGAEHRHWDLLEDLYRTDVSGKPFYPRVASLFKPRAAADLAFTGEVQKRLASLPAHDALFAPLGIGRHVGHVHLRVAAEGLGGGAPLLFYEDFPYVTRWKSRFRDRPRGRTWTSPVITLSESAITARCDAVALYASQLDTLFGGRVAMERAIRRFIAQTGGERVWRKR